MGKNTLSGPNVGEFTSVNSVSVILVLFSWIIYPILNWTEGYGDLNLEDCAVWQDMQWVLMFFSPYPDKSPRKLF